MDLQYVTVVDWNTGQLVDNEQSLHVSVGRPSYLVAVAAKVGTTRLLDNILL